MSEPQAVRDLFIYRVGGGPSNKHFVVVSLDAFPPWATVTQIQHVSNHSRTTSTHWVLRSSGKAMVVTKFVRALDVQTEWARELQPGEQIALGRLAPHDLVVLALENGKC